MGVLLLQFAYYWWNVLVKLVDCVTNLSSFEQSLFESDTQTWEKIEKQRMDKKIEHFWSFISIIRLLAFNADNVLFSDTNSFPLMHGPSVWLRMFSFLLTGMT